LGRKTSYSWRWRLAALILLLLAVAAGWLWWEAQGWRPSREEFPTQGVLLGESDGVVEIEALAAIGADFVYLEASAGGSGRDAMLGDNLRKIGRSSMPYGAVHSYDPCIPAERQAANFVTIVPRGAGLLPPVIALDRLAEDCEDEVLEAAVESELTTFLNQVEGHAGQPAILQISPRFEEAYGLASRIERNLWLERPFLQPDYAGRPWTLWTANPRLMTEASSQPLRWVVVQR